MFLNINISQVGYPKLARTKEIGKRACSFYDGTRKGLNLGIQAFNIEGDTALLLNAGRTNNEMYKLCPNIANLKAELEKRIFEMEENFGKVRAFLYGGFRLNKNDPKSVESFNLYNNLADSLDELDVPFAMICGKDRRAPLDNVYAINNNVTIWNDLFKKFVKPANTPTQEEIINTMKKDYQFVESTDNHLLKFLENLNYKPNHLLSRP